VDGEDLDEPQEIQERPQRAILQPSMPCPPQETFYPVNPRLGCGPEETPEEKRQNCERAHINQEVRKLLQSSAPLSERIAGAVRAPFNIGGFPDPERPSYLFDAAGNMVADFMYWHEAYVNAFRVLSPECWSRPIEGACAPSEPQTWALRVRGGGRLQYFPDAEAIQDGVEEMLRAVCAGAEKPSDVVRLLNGGED